MDCDDLFMWNEWWGWLGVCWKIKLWTAPLPPPPRGGGRSRGLGSGMWCECVNKGMRAMRLEPALAHSRDGVGFTAWQ